MTTNTTETSPRVGGAPDSRPQTPPTAYMVVSTTPGRRMYGTRNGQPGFPPMTGKVERAGVWLSPDAAQPVADTLTATPNVRGAFQVAAIEA